MSRSKHLILMQKRSVLMSLIVAVLFLVPVAHADESMNLSDWSSSALELAMTTELAKEQPVTDQQLESVRGQGAAISLPTMPKELGIILWDEGESSSGGHKGSGQGSSIVTVQIRMGGR